MNAEQYERMYGCFDIGAESDSKRFHLRGYSLRGSNFSINLNDEGNLGVSFGIDSPEKVFAAVLGGLQIPFTPFEGFHFDNIHVWIFPIGHGKIRIEIRVPVLIRRASIFADAIYGLTVSKKYMSQYLIPAR